MSKFVRLHYFDKRGEAEVIRLLFKVLNIKFDDKRYTTEQWETEKSNFKVKDLPLVENSDGRQLTEPSAITRFFSLNRGLMGTSDWEYYMIEKSIENVCDATALLDDVVYNSKELDEDKRFVLSDTIKSLNKLAEVTNTGYMVGKTTSLADVYVLVLLDYAEMRAAKDYFIKGKKLETVKLQMMKTYPEINSWISTMRPITDQ